MQFIIINAIIYIITIVLFIRAGYRIGYRDRMNGRKSRITIYDKDE